MNDTNPAIVVCDECGDAIRKGGDWSHLADDEETATSADAFVERFPNHEVVDGDDGAKLTSLQVEIRDGNTYFRCPCCGFDALGGTVLAEAP